MTTSTGEGRGPEADAPERGAIPLDTFVGRLKLARLHAGDLNIMEAAERCGLSNQSWSNWENGKKPRDMLEVTAAISEGLGIDLDWLRDGGPLVRPERHRLVRRPRPRQGDDGVQPTVPKVGLTERTTPIGSYPTGHRPNGRPGHATPNSATRRPARTGRSVGSV